MAEQEDDTAEYEQRVINKVLGAVVDAGTLDSAEGGHIHLDAAVNAMADAIALLVAAAKVTKTPKDRRDVADLCRKRILTLSNSLAQRVANGHELPWTLEKIGRPN